MVVQTDVPPMSSNCVHAMVEIAVVDYAAAAAAAVAACVLGRDFFLFLLSPFNRILNWDFFLSRNFALSSPHPLSRAGTGEK